MTKTVSAPRTLSTVCAIALASAMSAGIAQTASDSGTGGNSAAQNSPGMGGAGNGNIPSGGGTNSGMTGASGSSGAQSGSAQSASGPADDTIQQVNNAAEVVKQMESDPQLRKLMQQAKGMFIVPQYGRGGLGIAGRGGEGVMLANDNGKWSNPVFYNFGGVSIGAQAGAEVGSIAMLLMNDKAVNNFMQDNKFSLTADAGLTIVNYTAKAQAAAGRGDVIVWSDTKGAFADAAVGVTDINFDDDENQAFYKSQVSAKDIVGGKVRNLQAGVLTNAMPEGGSGGARASGASGGATGGSASGKSNGASDSAGGK